MPPSFVDFWFLTWVGSWSFCICLADTDFEASAAIELRRIRVDSYSLPLPYKQVETSSSSWVDNCISQHKCIYSSSEHYGKIQLIWDLILKLHPLYRNFPNIGDMTNAETGYSNQKCGVYANLIIIFPHFDCCNLVLLWFAAKGRVYRGNSSFQL